jgi:hypothetical protein
MADTSQPPGGGSPAPLAPGASPGGASPGGAPPGGPDDTPPASGTASRSANPTEYVVERTRAWTGMWVVAAGDVAIALAAIWGVVKASGTGTSGSIVVAILTSAFTAIGTMTTAYFGIRASSNTAQHYKPPTDAPSPPSTPPPPS